MRLHLSPSRLPKRVFAPSVNMLTCVDSTIFPFYAYRATQKMMTKNAIIIYNHASSIIIDQ